jgi:Mrp family chromosome partitioning ATPase
MSNTQRRGVGKPPEPGAASTPAATTPATTASGATTPSAPAQNGAVGAPVKDAATEPVRSSREHDPDTRATQELVRGGDPDDPTNLLGGLLGRSRPTAPLSAHSGGQTQRHAPVAATAALPPQGEKPKVWVATHKPAQDPDPRLILLREPDSSRAAAFRVLRHRLAERGDPRIIAVSSAEDKEGKTTCAANLAMALSECGRAKVLLIEANLRTPSMAALFGFLPPECFSSQLQRHRERPLEPWSIVEAFSPFLHVAAVKPGQEPRPLLDAPSFAIAIEMLARAGYDYMVIDTPSVLGSADVNLVEDSCDGVLLTTWARTSTGRALRRAVEQLSPAKVLGVLLLDA